MGLQIDPNIFKWLQFLNIIKEGHRTVYGKIQLEQDVSMKFYDGVYVGLLIKSIIKLQPDAHAFEKLDAIKENSTPAIRLYNWNILCQMIKKLGLTIEYAEKSKILNLQPDPILKILQFLHTKQEAQKVNDQAPQQQSKGLKVDINQVQKKQLKDTQNILQFFVVSISKNFKLSPQHTLNLFLDNNKFLAHLIVKGVKNSFDPIYALFSDIANNIERIVVTLFNIQEKQSVYFFLNAIKPALISKQSSIAENSIQIMTLLHQTYKMNSMPTDIVKNWIKQQGINTLFFSIKRYPQLLPQIIKMAYLFIQKQLFPLLEPSQKSLLWENETQKITFYINFISTLSSQTLQQYCQSSTYINWIKYIQRALKKFKEPSEMCSMLSLMSWCWENLQQKFQQKQHQLVNSSLGFLKSCSIHQSDLVFSKSIIVLFDLMEILGNRKNNNAPLIYKILINCFTYCGIPQRINLIALNFKYAFQNIKNLPGSTIVQPLLKNIEKQASSDLLTLCRVIIQQRRVNQDQLIQLVQMLTSITFHDPNYGQIALQCIFDNISSMNQEMVSQFVQRNMKNSLAHFYSITSSIKRKFSDLRSDYKRYGMEESMKKGQNTFTEQMQKHILLGNLVTLYRRCAQQSEQAKVSTQALLYFTYIRIRDEAKKEEQAKLLLPLMKLTIKHDDDVSTRLQQFEDELKPPPPEPSSIESPLNRSSIKGKSSRAQNSSMLNSQVSQASKPITVNQLKPTISALKDLQKIKQKVQNHRAIEQKKSKQKDLLQQKKQLLRSVINQKRIIEFGHKGVQNMEYKCIYDWQTAKQEDPSRIYGIPNLKLLDLTNQQQTAFLEDADSIMKKYRKVWRFLFFKYSTFGARNKQQIRSQQKINMAQIWKMLKQYDCVVLKKQESQAIIRMINQNMKRKNDLQNLTYLGFQQYILQMCNYGFGKIGYSHVPPGQKLRIFVRRLKKITAKNGGNTDLFENPEQVYFQQTEVIRQFNKRLKQNPQYILPQGYKKIKLTELFYDYQIHPANIKGIPSSYNDVYQVLDQIISECSQLAFHLIQPLTYKDEVHLAKPCLFQNLSEKMKQHSESKGYMLPKKPLPATAEKNKRQQPSIIYKQQFHPHINFSLGIKLGIAGVGMKYRFIAEEVAYWVDDMLDSIQNGQLKVQNKAKKKIDNEVLKKKRASLYKMKIEQKSQQAKWRKRAQSVKIEADQIRQKRKLTDKQERLQKKHKKQIEKQKQQQLMKKKVEEWSTAKNHLGQKRKQQQNKKKQEVEKKKKENEEYSKGVKEYFKKKKSWLQEKQHAVQQVKQDQQKKQQEQVTKKKQLAKKIHISILKKQSSILEKVEQSKKGFDEVWSSKQIQDRFKFYQTPLRLLFDLLVKQDSKIHSIGDQISQNTLQFFAVKFKIVPFMIQKNMLTKIVNISGRTNNNTEIDFKQFIEIIFRISVKAKDMLNSIILRKKQKQSQSRQLSKNQSSLDGNDFKPQESGLNSPSKLGMSSISPKKFSLTDEYLFNAEGVTSQTIDQFMKFLNLPRDKLAMDQRYRQIIQEKNAKPKNILVKELKSKLQMQHHNKLV